MSQETAKNLLTPTRLRIVLSASLVLIAIGMAVVFSFAQHFLQAAATDVNKKSLEAQASSTLIQTLQNTKVQLADNQPAIKRASEIVAESKQYQYQNQIVNDLTQFADGSGVTISAISFPTPTAAASSTSSTPAAQSATPATTPSATSTPASMTGTATTGPLAGNAATPAASLKSITASVTIKSPVSYTNFLNFLNAIQNNLTKMQVSNLTLSYGTTGLTSDVLNIQVYIR